MNELQIESTLKAVMKKEGITGTIIKMGIREDEIDWRVHHIDRTPIEYGIQEIPTRKGAAASFRIIPPSDEAQKDIMAKYVNKYLFSGKPFSCGLPNHDKVNQWLRQEERKKIEKLIESKARIKNHLYKYRYSDYKILKDGLNNIEVCLSWPHKHIFQKKAIAFGIQRHLSTFADSSINFQTSLFFEKYNSRIDRINIILKGLLDEINQEESVENTTKIRMQERLRSNVSLALLIIHRTIYTREMFYDLEKSQKNVDMGIGGEVEAVGSRDNSNRKWVRTATLGRNWMDHYITNPIKQWFNQVFDPEMKSTKSFEEKVKALKTAILEQYPELENIDISRINKKNYDAQMYKIEKKYKKGIIL